MSSETRIRRLPRFGVVDGSLTPHPRGTVVRLDDVLAALEPTPDERPLDVARLARAMRSCEGVKWPKAWLDVEHNFDWVARQVAAIYSRLSAAGE